MTKIRITNEELQTELIGRKIGYPKYLSPILNLANRFAQATRPKIVGQMTELAKPFRSYREWKGWYLKTHSEQIEIAVNKITKMLENFKEAINLATKDKTIIRKWVEDLILSQTYIGVRFQEAILKRISKKTGKKYRIATPEEESRGIDGFINNVPVSIKPLTYKLERKRLEEKIKAKIIYYEKLEDGIEFEFNLDDFK